MARIWRVAVVVLLIAAIAMATGGCGGSKPAEEKETPATGEADKKEEGKESETPAASAGEKYVIGWSQRALAGTPWFEAQVKSAQQTAEKLGMEIIILDAQNKPEKQVADLEDLVSRGVDAIVIDACHPTAVARGIEAANKAGIPVIAVDSAMDTSVGEVVTLITSDNYSIGYGAGREVAKAWNKKDARIVIMSGNPGDVEGWQRRTGFLSGFSEYLYEKFGAAKLDVLAQRYAGDWDPDKAMSQMQDLLVKFPNQIDVLFSEGDAMALGCLQAAKAANAKFLVGSIDGQKEAIEALMQGEITAIGVNSAVETGKAGIEYALKKLKGETVPSRIYLPSPVITKDNVKDFYKPDQPFL